MMYVYLKQSNDYVYHFIKMVTLVETSATRCRWFGSSSGNSSALQPSIII